MTPLQEIYKEVAEEFDLTLTEVEKIFKSQSYTLVLEVGKKKLTPVRFKHLGIFRFNTSSILRKKDDKLLEALNEQRKVFFPNFYKK